MTHWHTDNEPECEHGDETIEMTFVTSVLHGETRRYECPECGRETLISNNPQKDTPVRRNVRSGGS